MNPTEALLRLFTAMAGYLKSIKERLAPDNPTNRIILCNPGQHTPGTVIESVNCNGPFNVLINNLEKGTVLVYVGGGQYQSGAQPQLVLKPIDNPLQIPLGTRRDKNVVFVVDPDSPEPAKGSIWLEFY